MNSRRVAQLATWAAGRPPDALAGRLAEYPRCPVTRYLLGCYCLDRRRVAIAVRHLMIAHHVEPQLESAALLAFTGLNWIERPTAALLPIMLETWEEFRRPDFDRTARERHLLDAWAEDAPDFEPEAPLARRLWRLPIRTLRMQLREALVSPDPHRYPQLSAPA